MKDLVLRKYEITELEPVPQAALVAAAQTIFEAETGIPVALSLGVACDHSVSVVGWATK